LQYPTKLRCAGKKKSNEIQTQKHMQIQTIRKQIQKSRAAQRLGAVTLKASGTSADQQKSKTLRQQQLGRQARHTEIGGTCPCSESVVHHHHIILQKL